MIQNNKTNIDLPTNIHDVRNGLNYTLHGDYYLPDITIEPGKPLGKYGRARLRYLKEHRSNLYTHLLFSGKLFADLNETDAKSERLLETMIPEIANQEGITEKLKSSDPMKWVGMMNAIKAQVEETIWNELICV